MHPQWGERFFPEHDMILEFTVQHMLEQFKVAVPNWKDLLRKLK
jgi:hypothetical protein